MQRRQFLAAAAALAALPQTAAGDTLDPSSVIEDRSVTDDGAYSVTDCGSVPGGLNDIRITADMNNGPVEVEGVHEENGWSGVGLRWTSGPNYGRGTATFTPGEGMPYVLIQTDSAYLRLQAEVKR